MGKSTAGGVCKAKTLCRAESEPDNHISDRGEVRIQMKKIIITAAVTGSIHTPTMSEHLPITPDQIADDAVKSWKAGAAVAHIHVRDSQTGRPTADPDIFFEVCGKIKNRCDLVLLPTTGGGPGQTLEEKLRPIARLKPEMCSFDPAPFNLGVFQLAQKYEGRFKFDWEKDYLEHSKKIVGMAPTFEHDISYAKTMLEYDIKPEFEIYELGHIGYVTWLMKEGLVASTPHLQFVLGPIVGWMKPSIKHLVLLYEEAKDMLGEGNFTWSVAGAGRWQIPLAATAMAMNAPNVRVGMEDSLYAGEGKMATSSADQVRMVVNIARELSMEPASPNEAREILGVKGLDKVAF
jgi:uncharacterized protein (DUF849 family)